MGGGGLLNFDIEWRGGLQKITNLPLNFANPPYALINESPLTSHPRDIAQQRLNIDVFVIL